MIDPSQFGAPVQPRPPWALVRPPDLRSIRRGVPYVGLDEEVLTDLLLGASPIAALGAMGPALFFGREEDSWIPWDPDATDENLDLLVKDRPWPYCWGDSIWAVVEWESQPAFLRWEIGVGGSLFVGPPEFDRTSTVAELRNIARREAGGALEALPAGFWRREAPP
jgi:hypothetical protein